MAKELNLSLGLTGQTVTASIYLAGVLKASAIACAEVGATGLYAGDFAAAIVTAGVYEVVFFLNGATVAAGCGQAVWDGAKEVIQTGDSFARVGAAGAGLTALGDARLANLDAAISSRSTYAGGAVASVTGAVGSVTSPVTVGTNNDKTGYTASTVSDKTGYGLSAAAVQAVWDAPTANLTTAASVGLRVVTDIDAAISSRSTYAGADTAGTTTLLTRVPSALTITAGKVDVNDKTGYSLTQNFPANFALLGIGATGHITNVDALTTYTGNTPQTGDSFARVGAAGAGLTALGDARLANLDAAISTRTKPADTQAAVTTVTNLTNAPTAGDLTATMKASVTAAATAATPVLSATGVSSIWNALTSGMTTVGSVGKWIVTNVDAAVSSRSTYAGGAVASVTGAVGSVTSPVTVGTNNDKTGYTASTVSDKTGYGVSAVAVQAIWDAPTANLTTAASVGLRVVTDIDAAISSRSTFAGGVVSSVTGSVGSVVADVGITQAGADKVWSTTARSLTTFGTLVADVATAVWGAASRLLTAGTNIVLAKGTGITGLNDLSAAQVTTAATAATPTAAAVTASVTLAASQHVIVDSGTVTTVTNQLTAAQIASGVWKDTVATDFTTAASVGLSVMNGVPLGTGLTTVSVTGAVGSVTGSVGGNVVGSVGSVVGNVGGSVASVTAAVAVSATGVSSIWNALTSGMTTTGSIGKLLTTDIDAAISSRSTYGGTDTAGTTTLLARVPTYPANFASLAITAGGAVTAGTVGDKTGYALTQSFPTNFSAMAISIGGGVTASTIGDKTGYSLTQAFPTNFASLGIGATGHIINVDTLATYTGNTPQTGDSFARVGAAGAGLTALGDARLANLDAAISTRLASASYVDPWAAMLPGAYAAGTAGRIVGTNLDAAISTRSTLTAGSAMTLTAAYDAAKTAASQVSVNSIPTTPLLAASYVVPPTVADIRTEMDTHSIRLAHLDTDVSTRSTFAGGAVASVTAGVTVTTNNDKAGYALTALYDAAKTAAPAATALSTAVWTEVLAGRLDVAISSRLPAFDYVAPDNVGIAAIEERVNAIPTAPLLAQNYVAPPSAATIAGAVWDETLAGHIAAGSTGSSLNAASSAGDPWATVLPGAYGAGTAGKIVGTSLDAAISTRTKPTDTQDAVMNAPTVGDFTPAMKGYLATLITDPLLSPVPGDYPAGTAGRVLGNLSETQVTFVSPISQDGEQLRLIAGDDYLDTDARALEWSNVSGTWPNLTDATVALFIQTRVFPGMVVTPTGDQKLRFELTMLQTGGLVAPYSSAFSIKAVLRDGSVVTLLRGDAQITTSP
jgi:hypothetical protein